MAWTTPKTWARLDRLNPANLNQYIRDNQLALRAAAAALGQRVQALENGGFSEAMMRTVSFSTRSPFVITDLVPPANTKLFYVGIRLSGARWTGGFFVDYAVWSAFDEFSSSDSIPSSSDQVWRFQYQGAGLGNTVNGFIGRGNNGGLLFGATVGTSRDVYDRVCARWYL